MKNIVPLIVMSLIAVVSCGPMLPEMPVNEPGNVMQWTKHTSGEEISDTLVPPVSPADTVSGADTLTPPVPPADPVDTSSQVGPTVPDEPQDPTSVTVDGVEYHIAKFADGRWWMTENLRVVPEGAKFGEDIFYPCSDTAAGSDETAEGIARKGLLYADHLAFGTTVTAENCSALEGAQGICPDGWHIPTANEWMALLGKCAKGDLYPTLTTAAYYSADLDSGSIDLLENAGFNPVQCGYGRRGSSMGYLASAGKITMSYYFGSSAYTFTTSEEVFRCQFLSCMLAGNNGKASVALQNSILSDSPIAGAVRCIKNE